VNNIHDIVRYELLQDLHALIRIVRNLLFLIGVFSSLIDKNSKTYFERPNLIFLLDRFYCSDITACFHSTLTILNGTQTSMLNVCSSLTVQFHPRKVFG
jgi:hypothetical protein